MNAVLVVVGFEPYNVPQRDIKRDDVHKKEPLGLTFRRRGLGGLLAQLLAFRD